MNYKSDLVNKILPFWLDNAIDYKNGGIYTCLDKYGKLFSTDKSVWFQGRALWTFSKAYNIADKNKDYLKAAENIYNFLPKCTDTDGRMFFTVTEDGKELQKRRYYFSETFASIGCAEYFKASGNKEALTLAEKYFNTAYDCFIGKITNTPKLNPENCSSKSLSPVMIMLSTAQVLRSITNNEKYNKIATDCAYEIINGGFLKDDGLYEMVNITGEKIDSPSGRTVNPGHSLEAAWFLMSEGILSNDKKLIECGKEIIDKTIPLGLDKKHEGIISFIDVDGKPPVQLEWDMKLWWPQCEALIALKMANLLFNDNKYLKLFEELKEYCKTFFIDEENGEWYGYLHYDNTLSTYLKGNIFKGPFHIPRMYMIMNVLEETKSIKNFF